MPAKVPKPRPWVCQPTKKPLSRYLAGLESRKPRKKSVMNSKCPFDPNTCIFLDNFCSEWQSCEKCSCKFLRLLNREKDNKIAQFAPNGWEADECADEGRDLSTQLVAMQTLKSIETDTIHFESEEFMIPDLTEAEIDSMHFLLTKVKRKLHL